MLGTQNSAVRFISLCVLLALVSAWAGCVPGVGAQQQATRAQTTVPPQTTAQPTQTAPARTGRSYDTGAPTRRPQAAAPQQPSPVTFTDITAQSGVTFRHAASPTSQKYLLEAMGGGVAVFDYDNDGRLDLFFTNGARLEDPMPKGAAPDAEGRGAR